MAGFDGTDPCWIPRVPYQKAAAQRLRKAQFGDGYQQRMLDGINSLDQRWPLTFELKPKNVILAMNTYLVNEKGSSFKFLDPIAGVTWDVFCDEWEITWEIRRPGNAYYGSLSAEFYTANGVLI